MDQMLVTYCQLESLLEIIGKVRFSRLYLPNEGSLVGCEPPPVRFEPRTHRLRGWTIDFPLQVPRLLLEYPELSTWKS